MAINLVIDDKVTFKVKGTETDSKGITVPFDFSLTAIRLDQADMDARRSDNGDQKFDEFLLDVVQDWSGVFDDNKKQVPFDRELFKRLMQRAGLAVMAFRAYVSAIAVKEKN